MTPSSEPSPFPGPLALPAGYFAPNFTSWREPLALSVLSDPTTTVNHECHLVCAAACDTTANAQLGRYAERCTGKRFEIGEKTA